MKPSLKRVSYGGAMTSPLEEARQARERATRAQHLAELANARVERLRLETASRWHAAAERDDTRANKARDDGNWLAADHWRIRAECARTRERVILSRSRS